MDVISLSPFDQVDRLVAGYVEIPMYDYMFESADPKTAAAAAANANIKEQSTSLLQKIIDGIKAIFRTIKEKLTNMFDYVMAGADEKIDFDTFLKEIQGDPEFKGKKVTFHDYRKIIAEMDSSCEQFEKEYIKFKESEAEENPNLIKTIQTKLDEFGIKSKEVLQSEGASFALETALVYAQQNRAHAKKIKKMIDFDMGLLAAIERELGSSEVRKFKKKIRKLNNSSRIVRLLAGGRQKETATLEDALRDITKSVIPFWKTHLWKIHRRARNGTHKEEVRASEGPLIRAGMGIMRANRDAKKTLKNNKRALRNNAADKAALAKEMNRTERAYDKAIAKKERK